MTEYLVATIKPWNLSAFEQNFSSLPGVWYLAENTEELISKANKINPRYIFFPHWSWLVPESLTEQYECICFHMTDLPYGRGGSPLQNLILNGRRDTKLTALRMEKGLDAGPVYTKMDLSLEGSAQEIYERAADRVYDLIKYILDKKPKPLPQEGKVTVFERRKPEQSILPKAGGLDHVFDYIRMLDAESYPRAYIEYGEFRIEFSKARQSDEGLYAEVLIGKRDPHD